MRVNWMVSIMSLFLFLNLIGTFAAFGNEKGDLGDFEESFRRLGGSLDSMTESLKRSMGYLENKMEKAAKKLNDLKPTDIGMKDDKMYPESDLIKQVRVLKYPATSFSAIRFDSHLSHAELTFSDSPDANIEISVVTLADPENADQANVLADSLSTVVDNGELEVSETTRNYMCFTREDYGVLSLKGACYGRISIGLPAGSNISIYLDQKLVKGPRQPISLKNLKENVRSGFESNKLASIDEFVSSASPETRITAADLREIIQSFSFSSGKISALEKLIRFLLPEERDTLVNSIDSLFTFSSDQKKAYQIILRVR